MIKYLYMTEFPIYLDVQPKPNFEYHLWYIQDFPTWYKLCASNSIYYKPGVNLNIRTNT